EYQFGVEYEQSSASQGAYLHNIQTGRNIKRMDVFSKLHYLDTPCRNIGVASQKVEQTDTGIACKTFVNHLQGGHTPTNDTILAGQVIITDAFFINIAIGVDISVINTVQ